MLSRLFCLLLTVHIGCLPARAQDPALLNNAVARAAQSLDKAAPQLGATPFGVDLATYRQVLLGRRFTSPQWGEVTLAMLIEQQVSGSCGRFAAYVRTPPENGTIFLVLCPKFFTEGADRLRELTILHELVHVVAGPDECRAMAFAAHVEQFSAGAYTPVGAYWATNGCASSQFSLP
ncbi:MAG TPA: hypothetical protein VGN79_02470 [Devosia sp.]|nr:hypothetical protein [Devosia sp.]